MTFSKVKVTFGCKLQQKRMATDKDARILLALQQPQPPNVNVAGAEVDRKHTPTDRDTHTDSNTWSQSQSESHSPDRRHENQSQPGSGSRNKHGTTTLDAKQPYSFSYMQSESGTLNRTDKIQADFSSHAHSHIDTNLGLKTNSKETNDIDVEADYNINMNKQHHHENNYKYKDARSRTGTNVTANFSVSHNYSDSSHAHTGIKMKCHSNFVSQEELQNDNGDREYRNVGIAHDTDADSTNLILAESSRNDHSDNANSYNISESVTLRKSTLPLDLVENQETKLDMNINHSQHEAKQQLQGYSNTNPLLDAAKSNVQMVGKEHLWRTPVVNTDSPSIVSLPAVARLQGKDFEYFMTKTRIIVGRNSSLGDVDVHMGNSTFISREHVEIVFETSGSNSIPNFYLTCGGKNGLFVDEILQRKGAARLILPKK